MEDVSKMRDDFIHNPWVMKLMTDQQRRRRDLNQILDDASLGQQIELIKSISKKHERISRQLETEVEENKKLTIRATKLEVDLERMRWSLDESESCNETLRKELLFSKSQLDGEIQKVCAEADRKISRYKAEYQRMQEEFERKRDSLRKSNVECQNAKKKYEAFVKANCGAHCEVGCLEHEAAHLNMLINSSTPLHKHRHHRSSTSPKATDMNLKEPRDILSEINSEMETLIKQWRTEKARE
ncbi:Hypothetical predicted protein [Argonauta hians]